MKKKTKRLMQEMGKTHRQIAREETLRDRKKRGPQLRSNGNGLKKNMRHKRPIELQVAGQRSLKFCKMIPYTRDVKRLLGASVLQIIPKEIRDGQGMVPMLALFRDTKNNKLVISCNYVRRVEILSEDENGNAVFLPDTEFSDARY